MPHNPLITSFPGYPTERWPLPLMKPEGRGTSGIMAMGEALGDNEERDQLPFRPYAEAGSVLERALWRAGLPREALTLSNLVWYRPPRNWLEGAPWEVEAIRACKPLNDQLVQSVRPKVILALGGLAFRELTGMAGEKQGIQMTRGFQVPALDYRTEWQDDGSFEGQSRKIELPEYRLATGQPIPVVGTYHPSFLRRGSKERQKDTPEAKTVAAGGGTQGMSLLGVLIRDIQLAQDIARSGPKEFVYDSYNLGATLEDWRFALNWLREHPDLPLSYDFETKDSLQRDSEEDAERTVTEVTQVQISWRVGQALVSPWTPDLLPIFRSLMALPNPKLDWNGRKFDRPIARDMGVVFGGVLHDCMDFWHHAQPDLPRGLQFATSFFCPEAGPWKHLSGSDPLYYGALDVDMPQRIFGQLKTALSLVREPHSGVSLWSGYYDQVARLAPALDDMSERGVPVDETQRLALDVQFSATLNELDGKMQILVPDGLKNVSPKLGYVRVPKEAAQYLESHPDAKQGQSQILLPEGELLIEREFTAQVKCSCAWAKPKHKTQVVLELPDCGLCGNSGKVIERVVRWAKLVPFTPNGGHQTLRYIQHQMAQDQAAGRKTSWYVPEDYKTGRPTTAEAELVRLAKKTSDPLLPLILESREIDKARGTYVLGWKPDAEGRVHPKFGFKPATGQLSSEDPNGQNFPKHAQIARAMRRMIRARAGRKLVSFDWKSFHVLTTGFEAQDPLYMRLARLDMHSFFAACGLLKVERPELLVQQDDSELMARLSWYKAQDKQYSQFGGMTFQQIRDEKAKRAILGIGFGQQERSLYMLNPESYANIAEAKFCLEALNGIFPKPPRWRTAVRLEADGQAGLLTRHGYVRRFWDVFHRRPVASNFQPKPGQIVVEDKQGRRWALGPGDDHEAVVAFRPANDAFGIKRKVIVELHEDGLDERYGLILEIHDDLIFDCPDELLDEMIPEVKKRMEKPSSVLVDPLVAPEGLWCGVEVQLGQNWDKKDSENPEGMEKLKI